MINMNILQELKISENKNSLRIGTDAVLLAAFTDGGARDKAAELGTGTGIISLILAKRGAFNHIDAFEIQEEMCDICRENADNNDLSQIITVHQSDIKTLKSVDFPRIKTVFANPPYMKTDCGKSSPHEAREASRHEVFGGFYEFTEAASRLLKTGGKFYTVYRPDRLDTMLSSLKKFNFAPKRMTFVFSDSLHEPSMVLCKSVLGGAEGLKITPPLFLHNSDGTDSDEYTQIYQTGRLPKRFL